MFQTLLLIAKDDFWRRVLFLEANIKCKFKKIWEFENKQAYKIRKNIPLLTCNLSRDRTIRSFDDSNQKVSAQVSNLRKNEMMH